MEFKPSTVRMLSMLGPRGVLGLALTECAQKDNRIVALSADLCNTSGLDRFKTAFPDRFFNVGIAEQNMIGLAAGLAAEGKIPVATTFANFAALRACEQIRHFMGYMRENIKLVGFGAGFSFGMFGTTHYGVEDVAALRSIPNIVVLSPADGVSEVKAIEAMLAHDGPVYLRLTGEANHPPVYKQDFEFEIGRAIQLCEGADIAILAAGSMVGVAVDVKNALASSCVSSEVWDCHTIKPLDCKCVRSACSKKLIVTIEEHSAVGGLGSAVAECLCSLPAHPPLLRMGSGDLYAHAGDYGYMLKTHGLVSETIAQKIRCALGRQ